MRYLQFAAFTLGLSIASLAMATTYYVDFEAGDDAKAGTSKQTAWQHAPGDRAATGNADAADLQPGDTVKFKGGVVYAGSINITASGEQGRPITYDGNASGDWGDGPAIIDGSVPLTNLRQCASADEAWGNPNFKNIYWTTVPAGARWNTLNLNQGLTPLAWSQDPNPADPVLQENPRHFHKTDPHIPQTQANLSVRPIDMGTNSQRPLIAMFDNTGLSAVIENMNGGSIEISLEQPVTVTELGITPQRRYVNPKRISVHIAGKQVLEADLELNPDKTIEQKFKFDQPVTFEKMTIKFEQAYPLANGTKRNWGAIQKIAAYDKQGQNVFQADRETTLRHDQVFSQDDPNFYNNAILALYASPAAVYYKPIRGFDPQTNTITLATLEHDERPYENGGAFSIVNSPRFIDTPGEYALVTTPGPDGSHKLYLWPPDGKPENITRGQHGLGIGIRASHVVVDGFWVRKQGWDGSTGISGRGPATDVVIRNCKVTHLRGHGVGIHTTRIDYLLVADCEVADCAGHTKGILLRNAHHVVTRNCTIRKVSSTALDYYTVDQGVVQDCIVTENTGMHANGLTFYVGCTNILVERNIVRDGNVGLTVQDGNNMIIRNNIIEGGQGGAPAIGLWSGKPYNNIVITNNVIRYHGDNPADSTMGIYGGNSGATGYAIVNNILDGVSGNVLLKADMHHNIFTRYGPLLNEKRIGDNQLVQDLDKLFVNAAENDYRPVPAASPAIDAGVKLTTINDRDITGAPRPQRDGYDIGPHEWVPLGTTPSVEKKSINPRDFEFTFDGYEIAPPPEFKIVYEIKFEQRDGETITLKGVDLTGEGGGKVNRRVNRGGYVSAWFNPDHWLEWTVNAPEAGAYELAIDHASETNAKRKVLLNGQPVKGLEAVPFTPTGSWTAFARTGMPIRLMLQKGENKIRFEHVEGHLNFKSLQFIPVKAE